MLGRDSTDTWLHGEAPHIEQEILELVAEGLADAATASLVANHVSECEECAATLALAYADRRDEAWRAERTGIGGHVRGGMRWVGARGARLAYVGVAAAVLAIVVPVLARGGFATRQDVERRPFAARIEGPADDAIAVVYTSVGAVYLPPEPDAPEKPGALPYPSPPRPVSPVVLPASRHDLRDLMIGSQSVFRPGGRVHLVRWSQRTNRMTCAHIFDISEILPNQGREFGALVIVAIMAAESARPGDLPRVLVWWRSSINEQCGVTVLSYDASRRDDPLKPCGTILNTGWPHVGPTVMRPSGGDRDRVALIWTLMRAYAGSDVVPCAEEGVGIGITALDPFEVDGDCLSPFFATEIYDTYGLPTTYGLGSWAVPRFVPYPTDEVGTGMTVSMNLAGAGTLALFLNGIGYVVDLGQPSCQGGYPIDYWQRFAGNDFTGQAAPLLARQIHPVGPPHGPADPVSARDELLAALRADYEDWRSLYARTDLSHLPSNFRTKMADMYGLSAASTAEQ